MDNTKRKLTSPESSEENSKKSRNQLVNSLENLSNDLFYEIYDYLEGLDICVAFSNLNARFQQLIRQQQKNCDSFEDLNEIYQLIFSLPKLKSNKLDAHIGKCSISIPMSNNQQLSPITYLHIAHWYTFHELSALLSYTPSLRHLNLSHTNNDDAYIEDILPMNMNELIHLSIFSSDLNFHEFQSFVEKIHSKLQILNVYFTKPDIRFLHADRWQKLLLENFSQLEKFSLCYREMENRDNYPIYDGQLNQFVSPFWIQRNLIFGIEVEQYSHYYYVCPLKKRWYEYCIEHSKSAQLTIKCVYPDELPDILLNQIKRVLNFTQIYHLNIDQKISTESLMQIIHLLPDLISLKISALFYYESILQFGDHEFPTTSALEHASNIKYVCLEMTFTMDDISFLMSFCPHMEYLNVECIENMNIQSFLREILNKINQNHHKYLHELCIYIITADEQMIKQLKQMIDDDKLLLNYTIHRQLYNIYLKWK
ncbi:unnamed protein product [Adineta steineri]|uniref:F-box domain-containing protein n=3 Tax=Adineta steineri TaxID=433720 RepID=A0A815BY14_9BILA|nr:unnamed protein product [Adineta steineri]